MGETVTFNRCALLAAASLLLVSMTIVSPSKCPFPLTNETLQNTCDWSAWLSWNCTCCGSDVGNQKLAVRQRGICCDPNQTISQCFSYCGFISTDDTSYGVCGTECPSKTTPSVCHLTTAPSTGLPVTTRAVTGTTSGASLITRLSSRSTTSITVNPSQSSSVRSLNHPITALHPIPTVTTTESNSTIISNGTSVAEPSPGECIHFQINKMSGEQTKLRTFVDPLDSRFVKGTSYIY